LPATTNGRALVPAPAPAPEPTAPPPVQAQGEVRLLLRLVVGNRVKDTPLPISMDVFGALCCVAEVRGMTLGALLADIIMQVGT
jgi:hypothetical protein